MRSKIVSLVTMYVLFLTAAAAMAQDPATKKSCASPEYSQFDFWIGNWKVTNPEGTYQGSNRIEKILGGCVVQENWTGAKGSRGHSYNIYAKGRGVWHQTWVDANGTLLLLDGGLDGGRMVLSGTTPSRDNKGTVHHEISWTPMETGQVEQVWRMSRDGGTTWNDAFVGIYTRAE